eukprot:1399726-Pyramimonas_sp.AAC.1
MRRLKVRSWCLYRLANSSRRLFLERRRSGHQYGVTDAPPSRSAPSSAPLFKMCFRNSAASRSAAGGAQTREAKEK